MGDLKEQEIETVEIKEVDTRKLMERYTRLRHSNKLHSPYIRYYTQYLISKPWYTFHYFKGIRMGL